jgi:hypothetical protein
MAIWYILWQFGIFFPVLVFWTKTNLATLKTNTNLIIERIFRRRPTSLWTISHVINSFAETDSNRPDINQRNPWPCHSYLIGARVVMYKVWFKDKA